MFTDRIRQTGGEFVDNLALRVMARMFVKRHKPDLTEDSLKRAFDARDLYASPELLEHPDRFYKNPKGMEPLEARPRGKLPGGQRVSLKGESGFVPYNPNTREIWSAHQANKTLRAYWWRHHGPRPPAVLCLHGWGGGWPWFEERAFGFKRWYDAGLDVLLMMLPFHALRADPPRTRAPVFPSTKVDITVEGAAQAVWDTRRLTDYLLSHTGCPQVAVVGWSLGGLVASLLASLEPRLSGVATISPAASLSHLLWEHGEGHPERKRVEAAGYTYKDLETTWKIASPISHPVAQPPERLLIIAGQADRICRPEHVKRLEAHWNGPRVLWYPGGHILQFKRSAIQKELSRFTQYVFNPN